MRCSNSRQISSRTGFWRENSLIAAFISSRNSWLVLGRRAKPMTQNSGGSRWPSSRLYSAGSSLRWGRSPLAPKMTMLQGSGMRSPRLSARRGLATVAGLASFHLMAAKLVADDGDDLGGEGGFLAGAEALQQRQGQHRRGHVRIHGRFHRPAPFAGIRDPV